MDYFSFKDEFDASFANNAEISEKMGVDVIGIGLCRQKETYCPLRERSHFLLMLTLSGSAWIQEGKNRKRVFRNDWTILSPTQIHTYKSIEEWGFLYVKFTGNFIECIIHDFSFLKMDKLYFKQTDNSSELIFFKLAEIRNDLGLAAEIQRNALLLELLSNLHKNYASKGRNENPLMEAQKYIMRNLPEPISLDILARKANMSRSNFMKVFKERMGYTPINLINKLRIERAQELMQLYSSAKLSEIAEMSGFKDPYYFSRVFKKWTKMSPKDFRKHKINKA